MEEVDFWFAGNHKTRDWDREPISVYNCNGFTPSEMVHLHRRTFNPRLQFRLFLIAPTTASCIVLTSITSSVSHVASTSQFVHPKLVFCSVLFYVIRISLSNSIQNQVGTTKTSQSRPLFRTHSNIFFDCPT